MTSSAGKDQQEGTQRPTPETLAHWLLAKEADQETSSEELAAAGERVYLRLHERLVVLLGSTGFDALWLRSMHMAQRKFRSVDAAAAELVSTHTYGLPTVVHGHDSAIVQDNLIIAFASFIRLLFTFIGAELGLRFICQIWPDLSPHAAELRAKETTQ